MDSPTQRQQKPSINMPGFNKIQQKNDKNSRDCLFILSSNYIEL